MGGVGSGSVRKRGMLLIRLRKGSVLLRLLRKWCVVMVEEKVVTISKYHILRPSPQIEIWHSSLYNYVY